MTDETKRADVPGAMPDGAPAASSPSLPAGETQLPPAAPAFAGKAKDLEALRGAVVDAASVGAGLWLSYLFVLFYLAIATGSVTHRHLLFENAVKLPFLNVDLPLLAFFTLGPAIFLIAHAYVLLHFVLLAGKVGAFHAELQAQIADEDARTRLRRQLPSNIFVQVLAGPREVRTGIMGFLLRLIAQISLAAGPIALLVFFQLQFLPYQHEPIAWWQRIAVVLDLALLWALWPSIARGETASIGWRDLWRAPVAASALASIASVLLVFTVATFPGEWLHHLPSARLIPTLSFIATGGTGGSPKEGEVQRIPAWVLSIGWTSPHQLLVAGDVNFVARKPTSLWSNRLVLPGLDVIEPLSLRDRRLEGAVLIGAHLGKVDLTATKLRGAALDEADLWDAKFGCAESKAQVRSHSELENEPPPPSVPPSPPPQCTQLQGASLKKARLQVPSLDQAELQGAYLDDTQLQGASFVGKKLQGTSFKQAQLQGVSLEGAELQGASLESAQLQGASLNRAQLQGASLEGAELQGASLERAQLQGASLNRAQLQGASLEGAQLQGALLDWAHLQGASLDAAGLQGALLGATQLEGASLDAAELQGAMLLGTRLRGASLDKVFAWRTTLTGQRGARVIAPETEPKFLCSGGMCDWSVESYAAMKQLIEEQVPEGPRRNGVLRRIAILDPATPVPQEVEMAKAWANLAQASPSPDDYGKSLGELLRETGCESDGAPYVVRGLLRNLAARFEPGSPRPAALAAAFLDEATCPGARGLSEEEKAALRVLRDRAANAHRTKH